MNRLIIWQIRGTGQKASVDGEESQEMVGEPFSYVNEGQDRGGRETGGREGSDYQVRTMNRLQVCFCHTALFLFPCFDHWFAEMLTCRLKPEYYIRGIHVLCLRDHPPPLANYKEIQKMLMETSQCSSRSKVSQGKQL